MGHTRYVLKPNQFKKMSSGNTTVAKHFRRQSVKTGTPTTRNNAINDPTNIKNKWIFNKYCAIKIFSYLQCGNLHMDIEGAKNHINPTKHSRVGSIFTNKSLRDHPIAANTDIMIDLNPQSRGTIWNNSTMTRSVSSDLIKVQGIRGSSPKLGWRN